MKYLKLQTFQSLFNRG